MFSLMLNQAWRGLKQKPLTTAICVVAIGLGVGMVSSTSTLHKSLSNNPLPHKSDRIFNVRIDSWTENRPFFSVDPGDPPKHNTYRDMIEFHKSDIPIRKTPVGTANAYIFDLNSDMKAYPGSIQLVYNDFFAMFEAPFAFGDTWPSEANQNREPLVVLSHEANQKHFKGENSVGKSIKIGNRQFTISGVLKPFNPFPKVYDIVNNPTGDPREFYIPLDLIREEDIGINRSGDSDAFGYNEEDWEGDNRYTVAEYYWVQYWVELEVGDRAAYLEYINQYAQSQKDAGRHPRPINSRVQPMMSFAEDRFPGGKAAFVMVMLSVLFLGVCALNLTGLLMAKFLKRGAVVGVHRALGASRLHVFGQHIMECQLLALIGALFGVLVANVALAAIREMMRVPFISQELLKPDWYTFFAALVFSLIAGLVAGFYPSFRAGKLSPAIQIKL